MSVRKRFLVALGVAALFLLVFCTVQLGQTFMGTYRCEGTTTMDCGWQR